MKILYLDFFLGMEPEMLAGALVSLGVDKEKLEAETKKIFPGAGISCYDVKRAGLEALRCDVVSDTEEFFGYDEISAYLESLDCDETALIQLRKIFEIYFGEDKNAKISKTEICRLYVLCLALKETDADYVISSAVHEGSGFCEKDGGYYIVPSQEALDIFHKYQIETHTSELEKELTGTLGASVLAVVVNEFSSIPEMDIEKIGYGAGRKDYELPNLMRAVLGSVTGEDFEKMFASEEWFAEFSEEIFV